MGAVSKSRLGLMTKSLPNRRTEIQRLAAGSMAGWFGEEVPAAAEGTLDGLNDALMVAAAGVEPESEDAMALLADLSLITKRQGGAWSLEMDRPLGPFAPDEPCRASVSHGPGYRETTLCDRRGEYLVHRAPLPGGVAYWHYYDAKG